MNVLSLFDGISCGMIALERAGIKVNKYYASEIDPNAIKISDKNYPQIIRLGDVIKWREWEIDWERIDLLIGGSPCQGFSSAGKMLNFEDPRSKLFFEFVDILNHIRAVNPKIKFLLENVKMKKEWVCVISNMLGVEAVEIDSELVTPMRRKRLYWSNLQFATPIQKQCTLKDLIENNKDENYIFLDKPKLDKLTFAKDGKLLVKNLQKKQIEVEEFDGVVLSRTWQTYMPIVKGKSHCIRSANPDDVGVCVKRNGALVFRRFTLSEMEKMQTLPSGYTKTSGVSERKSKTAIGNAWTVDVIAHILKNLI